MKEIYIIRHGETDLNKLGIVQGRGVDADLNETGVAQGEAFFQFYKEVPFDRIYVSSLKRTRQTVQSFIDLGIPYTSMSELDELAWGKWEGKPNNEEARQAFKELTEQWQAGNEDAHFEGGESPRQVGDRLKTAMSLIISQREEKRVLICMHGRALRLLLCLLLEKPFTSMMEFPHQNTVLYQLMYEKDSFRLLAFNQTLHLAALNKHVE